MIFLGMASASAPAAVHQKSEIISLENTKANKKILAAFQLDLLMEWNGRLYFIVGPREKAQLQNEGIPFSWESRGITADPFESEMEHNINGAYHTYTELEQELKNIENLYPSIVSVRDIGDSLESRNIYAVKISDNVAEDENEAEVLFIGCHHAREWISVEVPFFFIKYLAEKYGSSDEIKNLVDNSEIWVIPLLNPDGLEYSVYVYRYWRKNMRDNGDGSFGVDLNRNYDYMWGYDNTGSSPSSTSAVYRGASPFSEPETRAVRDLMEDKHFSSLLSFHNYSQLILYPWGYTSSPSVDEPLFHQMARKMSELIYAVNGRSYRCGQAGEDLYLTNGDTTDWCYGIYGIPSFTIELPPVDILHGGFFNSEEDIQNIFNENLPAMIYLVEWSINNHTAEEY